MNISLRSPRHRGYDVCIPGGKMRGISVHGEMTKCPSWLLTINKAVVINSSAPGQMGGHNSERARHSGPIRALSCASRKERAPSHSASTAAALLAIALTYPDIYHERVHLQATPAGHQSHLQHRPPLVPASVNREGETVSSLPARDLALRC